MASLSLEEKIRLALAKRNELTAVKSQTPTVTTVNLEEAVTNANKRSSITPPPVSTAAPREDAQFGHERSRTPPGKMPSHLAVAQRIVEDQHVDGATTAESDVDSETPLEHRVEQVGAGLESDNSRDDNGSSAGSVDLLERSVSQALRDVDDDEVVPNNLDIGADPPHQDRSDSFFHSFASPNVSPRSPDERDSVGGTNRPDAVLENVSIDEQASTGDGDVAVFGASGTSRGASDTSHGASDTSHGASDDDVDEEYRRFLEQTRDEEHISAREEFMPGSAQEEYISSGVHLSHDARNEYAPDPVDPRFRATDGGCGPAGNYARPPTDLKNHATPSNDDDQDQPLTLGQLKDDPPERAVGTPESVKEDIRTRARALIEKEWSGHKMAQTTSNNSEEGGFEAGQLSKESARGAMQRLIKELTQANERVKELESKVETIRAETERDTKRRIDSDYRVILMAMHETQSRREALLKAEVRALKEELRYIERSNGGGSHSPVRGDGAL